MPWNVTLTDVVAVHMGHESHYAGRRVTFSKRSPQPTPLALIEMRLEFVELAMRCTDRCYICDAYPSSEAFSAKRPTRTNSAFSAISSVGRRRIGVPSVRSNSSARATHSP